MRTHAIFFRIVGYLLLGAISASTQEPTPDQPATPRTAPAVSSAQPSSLPASASQIDLRLPLHLKSVRFAVIGDSGTGGSAQYEIAKEMEAYREIVWKYSLSPAISTIMKLRSLSKAASTASDFRKS